MRWLNLLRSSIPSEKLIYLLTFLIISVLLYLLLSLFLSPKSWSFLFLWDLLNSHDCPLTTCLIIVRFIFHLLFFVIDLIMVTKEKKKVRSRLSEFRSNHESIICPSDERTDGWSLFVKFNLLIDLSKMKFFFFFLNSQLIRRSDKRRQVSS